MKYIAADKDIERTIGLDKLSNRYTYAKNFLYLGHGFNYPVALEGALKLKEISYIHAEGLPCSRNETWTYCIGRILAVVTEGDIDVREIADEVIEIPQTIGPFAPLLSVIPLQLLSYHVAVKKGLNVDMPRNLAKSVTVE